MTTRMTRAWREDDEGLPREILHGGVGSCPCVCTVRLHPIPSEQIDSADLKIGRTTTTNGMRMMTGSILRVDAFIGFFDGLSLLQLMAI